MEESAFRRRYDELVARKARARRRRWTAGVLAAALLAGGWWLWRGGGPFSPQARVHDAARSWAALGISDYDWTYTAGTYWAFPGRVTAAVRNGRVVAVTLDPPGPPEGHVEELTVRDVFRKIRDGIGADRGEFSFHAEWCVPERVFFDYERQAADEEWGFSLRDFTPLDPAAAGC